MAPTRSASKPPAPQASRSWRALDPPLSPWILDAVDAMGFDRMTPVQAHTIPLFVGNKDMVVEAVTGSGKTLSFLVPVVERLLRLDEPVKKHHVAAIVVSPTRELATQIYNVLISLLKFHAPSAAHLQAMEAIDRDDEAEGTAPPPSFPSSTLKIVPQLLLGGTVAPTQDLARFLTHSPNLLVCTPGRLLELLSSPHVHCPQSSFEVLVLDEADRLLDMGFSQDLTKILARLPKQRRTGLFSASVSEAVDQLVRVGLRNPVRIAVKVRGRNGEVEGRTPASLKMTYMTTPAAHKLPALLKLLRDSSPSPQKTIAYLSTCAAVDYFQHVLPCLLPIFAKPGANGLKQLQIIPLHGKHSPQIREKNFVRFTSSTTPTLLLTTDLAARGLDIPSVDLTVQIDPPADPKAFLHRAGRAGRAGRRGLATVFLLPGREADEYPSFLAVRSTPVEAHAPAIETTDDEAAEVMLRIRKEVLKDRTLYDKAQRGFVSWVRAYSKHEAKSIFRAAELPWRDVAEGWGLLRMPRMPELKSALHWDGDASLGVEVDWDGFAYKDREREKKRRYDLAHPSDEGAMSAAQIEQRQKMKKTNKEAWSLKKEAKEEREARRDKKHKRRDREAESRMSEGEREKKRELERMVDKIREQNQRTQGRALDVGGMDDEFEGFGD